MTEHEVRAENARLVRENARLHERVAHKDSCIRALDAAVADLQKLLHVPAQPPGVPLSWQDGMQFTSRVIES